MQWGAGRRERKQYWILRIDWQAVVGGEFGGEDGDRSFRAGNVSVCPAITYLLRFSSQFGIVLPSHYLSATAPHSLAFKAIPYDVLHCIICTLWTVGEQLVSIVCTIYTERAGVNIILLFCGTLCKCVQLTEGRGVYCMYIERAGVIIRLWESPVLRQWLGTDGWSPTPSQSPQLSL